MGCAIHPSSRFLTVENKNGREREGERMREGGEKEKDGMRVVGESQIEDSGFKSGPRTSNSAAFQDPSPSLLNESKTSTSQNDDLIFLVFSLLCHPTTNRYNSLEMVHRQMFHRQMVHRQMFEQ